MEAFFPIVFGSKQINAVFSLEKESHSMVFALKGQG